MAAAPNVVWNNLDALNNVSCKLHKQRMLHVLPLVSIARPPMHVMPTRGNTGCSACRCAADFATVVASSSCPEKQAGTAIALSAGSSPFFTFLQDCFKDVCRFIHAILKEHELDYFVT